LAARGPRGQEHADYCQRILRRRGSRLALSAMTRMAGGPGGMLFTVDERPTLFVCHGDDGGPRMHPCRRVQEAMSAKGIAYEKVIAVHGNPIPLLRRGS